MRKPVTASRAASASRRGCTGAKPPPWRSRWQQSPRGRPFNGGGRPRPLLTGRGGSGVDASGRCAERERERRVELLCTDLVHRQRGPSAPHRLGPPSHRCTVHRRQFRRSALGSWHGTRPPNPRPCIRETIARQDCQSTHLEGALPVAVMHCAARPSAPSPSPAISKAIRRGSAHHGAGAQASTLPPPCTREVDGSGPRPWTADRDCPALGQRQPAAALHHQVGGERGLRAGGPSTISWPLLHDVTACAARDKTKIVERRTGVPTARHPPPPLPVGCVRSPSSMRPIASPRPEDNRTHAREARY